MIEKNWFKLMDGEVEKCNSKKERKRLKVVFKEEEK